MNEGTVNEDETLKGDGAPSPQKILTLRAATSVSLSRVLGDG